MMFHQATPLATIKTRYYLKHLNNNLLYRILQMKMWNEILMSAERNKFIVKSKNVWSVLFKVEELPVKPRWNENMPNALLCLRAK